MRALQALKKQGTALPRIAWSRFRECISARYAYWVSALVWTAYVLTWSSTVSVRGIMHTGLFALLSMEDAPPIESFYNQYTDIYWSLSLMGAVLLGLFIAIFRTQWKRDIKVRILLIALIVHIAQALWSCHYRIGDGPLTVDDIQPLDWLGTFLIPVIVWIWLDLIKSRDIANSIEPLPPPILSQRRVPRPAIVYLLSSLAIFAYAIPTHMSFWEYEGTQGFRHTDFIPAGEMFNANMVLYTTSILFASLTAGAAVLGYLVYRRCIGSHREANIPLSPDSLRNLAILIAFVLTFVFLAPCLVRMWPETRQEEGFIFPFITFLSLWGSASMCIHATAVMLTQDLREDHRALHGLSNAETTLLSLLLWPGYPLLRLLRPTNQLVFRVLLVSLGGGLIVYLKHYIETLSIDFFDYKDIVHDTLQPCVQVFIGLLIAWFAYILLERLNQTVRHLAGKFRSRELSTQTTSRSAAFAIGLIYLVTAALLTTASAPFWYWEKQEVELNTYTRLVEYNGRHEFELLVLHWLFDADSDGYSAVLHGGDPDDLDPNITPLNLGIMRPFDMPIDQFRVVDETKAKDLPNIMVITLEGVTNRAISSYGQRRLAGDRKATPHIDSVAEEGTLFTNARAAYPSTWDAWLMISSGRFLSVTEMDAVLTFGDRYGRHNNMVKVLKAAGITRWCHANAPAYSAMIVGTERHTLNWEDEFDAYATDEESEKGILRGDKNLTRMERFLDSLKPGERFFISEHMSDTHFPWEPPHHQRAVDIGFTDGLEWAAEDAIPNHADHASYYQMITRMDWQIGQMLKMLKARDLYENTVIVIVSDHGCQWRDHGHMYYPGQLYDQAIHIPLIIRVPGMNGGGRLVDVPALQMDILTTLMELGGIEHVQEDGTTPLPGCSLLPWIKNTESQTDRTRCAQRNMVLKTHYDMVGFVKEFKYKLIADRPAGTLLLFDLENDPREMHNLVDSHPKLLEEMKLGLQVESDLRKPFLSGITREERD